MQVAVTPWSPLMPPISATTTTSPTRMADAARGAARRLVDVVETDLLSWDAARTLRTPKAQVELQVVAADAASADWRTGLPAARAADADAFVARGDRGLIALADGAFAGWIWVSRSSHRDPWSGLTIRLARDEAYAYALWVDPELRPKGVARFLMVSMLASVQAEGAVSRVYGWVDKRNRESQMLLRLLGFADVQAVKRVMVLDRLGRQVPGTDTPPFGPLSATGRHRAAAAAPNHQRTLP